LIAPPMLSPMRTISTEPVPRAAPLGARQDAPTGCSGRCEWFVRFAGDMRAARNRALLLEPSTDSPVLASLFCRSEVCACGRRRRMSRNDLRWPMRLGADNLRTPEVPHSASVRTTSEEMAAPKGADLSSCELREYGRAVHGLPRSSRDAASRSSRCPHPRRGHGESPSVVDSGAQTRDLFGAVHQARGFRKMPRHLLDRNSLLSPWRIASRLLPVTGRAGRSVGGGLQR